jgi:hypothetical protein
MSDILEREKGREDQEEGEGEEEEKKRDTTGGKRAIARFSIAVHICNITR